MEEVTLIVGVPSESSNERKIEGLFDPFKDICWESLGSNPVAEALLLADLAEESLAPLLEEYPYCRSESGIESVKKEYAPSTDYYRVGTLETSLPDVMYQEQAVSYVLLKLKEYLENKHKKPTAELFYSLIGERKIQKLKAGEKIIYPVLGIYVERILTIDDSFLLDL